jgi:DNA-binding NarL/FixJ family response regulator
MTPMDIKTPQKNCIEATREVLEANPETVVLALTMVEHDDSVVAAMRAGPRATS